MLKPSSVLPVAYSKRQATGDGRLKRSTLPPGQAGENRLAPWIPRAPASDGAARASSSLGSEADESDRSQQDDLHGLTLPRNACCAGSDAPSPPTGFETARSPGGLASAPSERSECSTCHPSRSSPPGRTFLSVSAWPPRQPGRSGYLRDGPHVLARARPWLGPRPVLRVNRLAPARASRSHRSNREGARTPYFRLFTRGGRVATMLQP
jgi:hypothetical protein